MLLSINYPQATSVLHRLLLVVFGHALLVFDANARGRAANGLRLALFDRVRGVLDARTLFERGLVLLEVRPVISASVR